MAKTTPPTAVIPPVGILPLAPFATGVTVAEVVALTVVATSEVLPTGVIVVVAALVGTLVLDMEISVDTLSLLLVVIANDTGVTVPPNTDVIDIGVSVTESFLHTFTYSRWDFIRQHGI